MPPFRFPALLIGLGAVGLAASMPAAAASSPDAFARSLDRPAAIKVVKAAGETSEITCTYYADLMVRETGTDTPDPDNATLVRLTKGAARPPCNARAPSGGIIVKTEGYGLEGRRGGFLIWDATDPNGAIDFMVIDPTGKLLFEDGLSPTPGLSRTATLEGGKLHLRYTHGFNANCSLAKDARTCWASLVAAGKAPKTAPALTAAPASCLKAYGKTARDDPSVITYTIDLTLDAAGKTDVKAYGQVSCQPQP